MVEWKKAVYMKQRVGQEFLGMVTGSTADLVFVTLDGLGVEGIMPGEPLRARGIRSGVGKQGKATAARRRVASAAPPRWRLGDRLRVRVMAVDTFRARVTLKPLSTG